MNYKLYVKFHLKTNWPLNKVVQQIYKSHSKNWDKQYGTPQESQLPNKNAYASTGLMLRSCDSPKWMTDLLTWPYMDDLPHLIVLVYLGPVLRFLDLSYNLVEFLFVPPLENNGNSSGEETCLMWSIHIPLSHILGFTMSEL